MLAAAFSMGDSDVVDRVIESFPKQRLGISLKKFTSKSILHIIKVFQSFKDPDIGHKTLSLFITIGVYSPDLRQQAPKLAFINDQHFYSHNLERWGKMGEQVWDSRHSQVMAKTEV